MGWAAVLAVIFGVAIVVGIGTTNSVPAKPEPVSEPCEDCDPTTAPPPEIAECERETPRSIVCSLASDRMYQLRYDAPSTSSRVEIDVTADSGTTLDTALNIELQVDGRTVETKVWEGKGPGFRLVANLEPLQQVEVLMASGSSAKGIIRFDHSFVASEAPQITNTGDDLDDASKPLPVLSERIGVTGDAILWNLEEATEFEFLTGNRPAMIHGYAALAHDVPVTELTSALDLGYEVMLTIEPWVAADFNEPASALAAGEMDGHLRRWAKGLMDLDRPILVRFMHEMNGNWYPWSAGWKGNNAESVRRAYIHAWTVFEEAGATNLRWVWSPNVGRPIGVSFADLYPGDAYSDFVGLDGYNGGDDVAQMGGWRTFEEVFSNSIQEIEALTDRQIIIAETASSGSGGDKSVWISEMFDYLETNEDIYAVLWFQVDKRSSGETDWRFNSDRASSQAFSARLRGS